MQFVTSLHYGITLHVCNHLRSNSTGGSYQQDGMLSLVYTSVLNGSQTTREQFANQMRVCVDGTPNLCCAVCERFTYHSPQTEICQFFAQTQKELNAPGVLCSPHCVPHANSAARKRCAQVYKALGVLSQLLLKILVHHGGYM